MNIKIYIVSHKVIDFPLIPFHLPICAGANRNFDSTVWRIPNLVCDNSGEDNISDKNEYYNELTAQYWMWRNIEDVDYIGLCHYRRYFNFSAKTSHAARVGEAYLTKRLYKKYGWNKQNISSQLRNIDMIVARPEPGCPPEARNIKENFEKHGAFGSFQLWKAVITEKYPEYLPYVDEYVNQKYKHMFNMFVMRKELFDEYSQWLFCILQGFEQKWKEHYGEDYGRICGLAGEHLLNVFMLYQQKEHNIKVKTLQTIMIYETSLKPSIKAKIIAKIKEFFTIFFPYGSIRRDKIKYKLFF